MLLKPRYPYLSGQHPLAKGLVVGYPLHEGGGARVNDLSGKQNSGSFTGTWGAGPFGSIVSTNGSTTEISIPDSSSVNVQTGGDFTISVWFLVNSLASSYVALFDKGPSVTQRDLSLFLKAGGGANTVFWAVGDQSGTDNINIGTTITTGRWWHLCVTRRGSVSSFFVNGALGVTNSTQTATATAGGALSLGLNPTTGGAKFNGSYGTFGLWRRALTPAEVRQLYSDSFSLYRPQRRFSWLNSAGGTTTPSSLEFVWDPQYPMRSRPRMFGAMLQDDAVWPGTAVATPSQYGWVAPETTPMRARFFRGKVDEVALANLATPTPTQQGFAWEPQFPTRRKPQVLQPDEPTEQYPISTTPTPTQFGWVSDLFLPIRRRFWRDVSASADNGPWAEPPPSPNLFNRVLYPAIKRLGQLMRR